MQIQHLKHLTSYVSEFLPNVVITPPFTPWATLLKSIFHSPPEQVNLSMQMPVGAVGKQRLKKKQPCQMNRYQVYTFIILFFIPNYDKNTPTKKATFSLHFIKKAKVVLIAYECSWFRDLSKTLVRVRQHV